MLYGQSYYFRHYQVENGLSNNAVICSVQDKNGFLWFGTKDGLDRFDGYSFKVFRNDPSAPGSIGNNFIHSLYEDRNGILWAGTENGLYEYDASSESFALLPGSANAPTRDIIMDSHGNLWFIGGFRIFKYAGQTKKLENFEENNHFEATSICISADETIWISTTGGLLKKYDAVANVFQDNDMFKHSSPVVSKWIEKIYTANSRSILIGTSNQGVKLFDIAAGTYKDILTYNNDKTEIFVRNFVQATTTTYWIATESGIFIYDIQTGRTANLQKKYNDPYSIADNAVYSFCKDREGGIWATTYFGGINYYTAHNITFNKWFPKTGENSLSGNVIREIHEDKYGNLWIGTEDAGLNKYDTITKTFTHYQPSQNKRSISYTNIHGLLANNDELWIGTFEHGLDVMNIRSGEVIQHYSMGSGERALKSNFIYCIEQLNKNEITLGTARGAYTYNRKTNSFSQMPGLPVNNWYTCIIKDHKGVIWASTYGSGILFYDPATKVTGNFRFSAADTNTIASDRVNSIFEDSKNNLWFATESGLCKFDRKKNSFQRFTSKNGFPSNFILNILEDDAHNLWISTSKGLVCFDPLTEQPVIYTRVNGILNDQFNFNSAYKDHRGTMYFGSGKGLISFNPGEFSKNKFIPPVYITGFQVFNHELPIGKKGSALTESVTSSPKITLTYDQSTFSIDFAALSYMAPEACEYAYKMEGLDKDWTYLKTNRKAYFTQLATGSYTFKVKASNNSLVWNTKETTLEIEILPPWWASIWAYICYGVALIAAVLYIIRSYHNRAEEKNRRKIEQLEIAKEKELFRAKMEFFTNVAHEIKTPLTLIKGPLEKVMLKSAALPEIKDSLRIMDRNTNRLIDLTNQLLDFRQTEIKGFSLSFTKANVTESLQEVCAEFKLIAEQKNITLNIEMPALIIYAHLDIEAFNKILTNLLSNAIKYAASEVFVILQPLDDDDKTFAIQFKNDGFVIPYEMRNKIFEPFFRLKETQKQRGTGIGLALSLSLAQLHKGAITLQEPVNGMNTFILTIPLHQGNTVEVPIENYSLTAINNK